MSTYLGSVEVNIYRDDVDGYYSEVRERPDWPDALPHLVKVGALTQAATQMSIKAAEGTDS